jgi:hypothetical protein
MSILARPGEDIGGDIAEELELKLDIGLIIFGGVLSLVYILW